MLRDDPSRARLKAHFKGLAKDNVLTCDLGAVSSWRSWSWLMTSLVPAFSAHVLKKMFIHKLMSI